MNAFAIWRRLDVPGHDAALLAPTSTGYVLTGTAVFTHEAGPACINYSMQIRADWTTERGTVRGFLADRELDHVIERTSDGWRLDGDLIPGLQRLVDLDFGFTPATNLQQLQRIGLAEGQSVDVPVVWYDVDAATLIELPQRYERRDRFTYWYVSPTVPYEALLELAPNGFVRVYPELWVMEE